MIVPDMIRTVIEVSDIIRRADAEFVPSTVINKYSETPYESLRTVLHLMVKHGFLRARKGQSGGYKFARPFTLGEAMKAISPHYWTEDVTVYTTADERVNTILRRTIEKCNNCSLTGRRLTAIEAEKE